MKAILLIIIMLPLFCQSQARLAVINEELLDTDTTVHFFSGQ